MAFSQTDWTLLLLLGLAAFRLTRLIVYDKITEPLRRPFFQEISETGADGEQEIYLVPKEKGFTGWIGQLLSCFWCVGIWVSLFLSVLYLGGWFWGNFIILVLAIAAIGSIIEVVITRIMDV